MNLFIAATPRFKFLYGLVTIDKENFSKFLNGRDYFLILWIQGFSNHTSHNYKKMSTFFVLLKNYLLAGLSICAALRELQKNFSGTPFEPWIWQLQFRMENFGELLSESFASLKKAFPHIVISYLQCAEATGNLQRSLESLIVYMNWRDVVHKEKQKIQNYLKLVSLFMVGSILSLVIFVIPSIKDLLQGPHSQHSPGIHKVIFFSDWAHQNGALLPYIIFVGYFFFCLAKYKKPVFVFNFTNYIKKQTLRHIPFWRDFERYNFWYLLAQFSKEGLPIQKSLFLISENLTLSRKEIMKIHDHLITNGTVVSAFYQSWLTPKSMMGILENGFETSNLALSSEKISMYLSNNLQNQANQLLMYYQPVGLLIIASFIIMTIYTIFTPLYSL